MSDDLPHRSYDKYHGKSIRKRVYWDYQGPTPSIAIDANKNKHSQRYDHESTEKHLYITAVDQFMNYKFINNSLFGLSHLSHPLHKKNEWNTIIDILEENSIKQKSYVEGGCQKTDYCLPLIGHIDKPKIEGDLYNNKTIRYFDDEHKDDEKYTAIYTVSFPKSIDDTIFYPVHCGKGCGICRDSEKPKGYMRRKTRSHLRQEVNEL
jgi:hypothetical protein